MSIDSIALMEEAEKEAEGKPARRVRGAKNVHGLTEIEEIFCAHYLKTQDGVAAMKAAGYAIPGPSFVKWKLQKLLDKPAIRIRLKEKQELASVDVQLTREIFHKKLLQVYDRALEDGKYKEANESMDILGKALGYFVEQRQNLNINANMEGISKGDRLERLTKLAQVVGIKLG
jgi:phage terminase small subunit